MAIPANIIFGWPSTHGTIPTGFSRETTLDGKHPKQIPNSSTAPGSTGGSATHTHAIETHNHTLAHTHASGNTAAGSGSTQDASTGTPDSQTDTAHVHTTGTVASSTNTTDSTSSDTTNTGTNDPARWDTIFIKSDGSPTTLPANVLAFLNSATLPGSWTQPTNGKDKFLVSPTTGADGGGTGGGAAHNHTNTHTHTSVHGHPSGTTGNAPNLSNSNATGSLVAADTHNHPYDVVSDNFGASQNGAIATTGNATPEPPWVKLIIMQSPGDVVQYGTIGLWLGALASIPTGSYWYLCDGTNGTPDLCQGKFVKGANLTSELGTTGGTTTHGHTAGGTHTHTWSSSAHTHTLTVNATTDLVGATGTVKSNSSANHTHATTTSGAANALTVGTANPSITDTTTGQHYPAYVEVAFIQYRPPGASYAADLDTTLDIDVNSGNVQKRLRIGIENLSPTAGATTAFKLRYSKNGGAYADVTASSSNVKTFSTTFFADGDDVPQLITSGAYQTDNNAAEESTGTVTLTAGLAGTTRFECEVALEFIKDDLADNDSLDFRITQSDGTVLDTYSQTANITITKVAPAPFTKNLSLNQTEKRASFY